MAIGLWMGFKDFAKSEDRISSEALLEKLIKDVESYGDENKVVSFEHLKQALVDQGFKLDSQDFKEKKFMYKKGEFTVEAYEDATFKNTRPLSYSPAFGTAYFRGPGYVAHKKFNGNMESVAA